MKPLYILIILLAEDAALNKMSPVHQDSGVKTVLVGHNVTLPCTFNTDTVNFLSWYKQSLGGKPDVISTRMMLKKEATMSPGYEERFQVVAEVGKSTDLLIIKAIEMSDSATYYCGVLEFNAIEFGEGVFLHVKSASSDMKTVVRQSVLEPLRVGDSVNLSCTVYSEPCAEEQSFYWFRHGADQPAVMYHSEGRCRSESGSARKNCNVNLTIESASISDAGMYYCALASCGETVFGNGTKVQIEGSSEVSPFLISCLSVALAVSIIVLLVLAFITYKLKKASCKEAVSNLADPAASDTPQSQDAESLHYAALSVNRKSERHRPEENAKTACVYSSVKNRKK